MKILKLLSLFSGIGAFEKALENIGEPFEVVRWCEIDKYASKAYSLIHNLDENMNLKDVCTVNTEELPDDIDIITYGFPCQDISQSGKQKGFTDEEGNLTRSGLFFEALRIIEETQPMIAIAENVKALTGKKFTAEFKIVLDSLNDAGYRNYWTVLNAKDYGIPQNRERVFIISIRDDIDHGFKFPEGYELKLRLKDLLEETVDEKYYLSDSDIKRFVVTDQKALMMDEEPNENIKPRLVGGIGEMKSNGGVQFYQQDLVYSSKHIAMAHPAQLVGGSYKYTVENCVQIGKLDRPTIHDFSNRVYSIHGLARTLMGEGGNHNDKAGQYLINNRIRKLTPKECFRLMGFDDKDCDILVKNKISNTQLYKMAGNSIVVDVLEEIFVELLNQYEDVFPIEGDDRAELL